MAQVHAFAQVVVLLPVYRPGPHLTDLIAELLPQIPAASRIVIVDDGSDPAAGPALPAARALGCSVLRHPANLGKGAALKTGFAHIRTAHPGLYVICADADGQHHAADIRRVAERTGPDRIVLGVRQFDRMPARSRIGNTVTRLLFRTATGHPVADTQTGLRAIPAGLLDWACAVHGDGFEYEMNILLEAAQARYPIEEVDIPARYHDGNASSNFSGLTDSIRVYRPLVRQVMTSMIGGGSHS